MPEDAALLIVSAALSQSWKYGEEGVGSDPERGPRIEHRLMWLCLRRGRVITWNDWDALGKQRGRAALQSVGTATRLVADGLRGGKDVFPKLPSRFRELMPPEGLSLPPPVSLGFFGARIEATDGRVEWCTRAVRRGGDPEPLAFARAKQQRWTAIVRLEIAASCLTAVALELSYNARVPIFPADLRRFVESTIPAVVRPMYLPERNRVELRVDEVLSWMTDAALVPGQQLSRTTHLLAERATAYASRAAVEAVRERSRGSAAPATSASTRRSAGMNEAPAVRETPGASAGAPGGASAAPGDGSCVSQGAGVKRGAREGAPPSVSVSEPEGAREGAPPSVPASAPKGAREGAPPSVQTGTAPGSCANVGLTPIVATSRTSGATASAATAETASAATSATVTGLTSATQGSRPQPTPKAVGHEESTQALRSVPAPVSATGQDRGRARDAPRAQSVARGAGRSTEGGGGAASPDGVARAKAREAVGAMAKGSGAGDESKGNEGAAHSTAGGHGRSDTARPGDPEAEEDGAIVRRGASATREAMARASVVGAGATTNATSATGVAPGAPAMPAAREVVVASVAAPPSPSGRAKREARPLSAVGADMVNAHELAGRFPTLRDIFVALGRDNGDPSGNVPVLGVLEALAGAVRRSDPEKPQQRRTVRGGSRGGAVERLSRRAAEAEDEAKTLRQHSATIVASLAEAHRRLDAMTAERDRARSACDGARADVERAMADRDRARDDARRAITVVDRARGALRRGREEDGSEELRVAKRRRGGGGGCRPGWPGPRWNDRRDDGGAWC